MSNSNVLPDGIQVADYSIVNLLGSGGFGMTYKALDRRLKMQVALKEYFPAELARRRSDCTVETRAGGNEGGYAWGLEKFEQEATTLARLHHQNIVGISHLFRANGTAYIVLDLIHGPSLKEWLKRLGRPANQDEVDDLLFPLLDALDAVHGQGLMHRDIAPKNIMIAPPFKPILIDFGTVRQLVAQRSQTLYAVLTPGYAPVEQYVTNAAQQGPWTDIYSLGVTIYEAMTGRLPPEATERSLEDRIVPAAEIGRGRYRPEFLSALDWALMPLPKDRPQSVASWRAALLKGLPGGTAGSGGSSQHGSTRSKMGRWFGKG